MTKTNKKSKLKVIAPLLFACIFCASVATTAYGAWRVASDTWNYVSTSVSFGAKIDEVYNPPETGVFPGAWVEKQVKVTNTGNASELVRVKLTRLVGKKSADGTLVPDTSLSPDIIQLDLDLTDWVLDSDKSDDGEAESWYYYKGVLEPGKSTSNLLKGFIINKDASNQYQSLDCQIIVDVETVQYEGDGIAAWGKTYKYLGIKEPSETVKGATTKVTFISPEKKFDIATSKTDLFANFKYMLPGTIRTQKIVVENKYDKDVNIELESMLLDDNLKSKNEKLYTMMTKYMTIKITDSDGKEIYSGPAGSNKKCNISLGKFKAGEKKTLNVTMSVSSVMNSEYESLLGRVKWSFVASEVAQQTRVATNVQTGGENTLWINIACIACGIAGIFVTYVYVKHTKKQEKTQ